MEVREGMSKVVLTLGPGHTLRDAATRMTEKGVGAAVVIDEEYPGPRMISERDILNSLGRGQDPDAERVADHMSATLIAASRTDLRTTTMSVSVLRAISSGRESFMAFAPAGTHPARCQTPDLRSGRSASCPASARVG